MARGRRVRRRLVGRGDLLAWPWSLRRRHRGDRGLRRDGCPWHRPLCPRPPGTSVCCPLDLGKYSSFRGASVVVPPLASRGCTRTLTARAPCRARLHLAPFGGGASGDRVGVARPLGGPSEWETGEYLAGTGQMESTGSRGQPGLSCRQQEASVEQPRAPRAGSAGQTPVPVGSRGASPARGRGCGIVTHGGGDGLTSWVATAPSALVSASKGTR